MTPAGTPINHKMTALPMTYSPKLLSIALSIVLLTRRQVRKESSAPYCGTRTVESESTKTAYSLGYLPCRPPACESIFKLCVIFMRF